MRIGMALLVVVAGSLGWFGPALARQAPSPPGFASRPASAIQYLKASNPGEDDRLGIGDPLVGVTLALSADGNTLAVSAPHEDSGATGINGNQRDESAWDSGAVYVFTRSANRWTQQAYLKASNTQVSDKFGFSVALSGDGNTLAVGATLEDSSSRAINGNQADNSAESSGAVYVFARSGGAWSQQAYLKASNADPGDQFGWSVAISGDGNTLAVGAQTEAGVGLGVNADQADNSAADAGAVYVFARAGAAWAQRAYVKASNTQAGDRFGFSVTLSADGNTLAAGSYDEDGGGKDVNPASDEAAPNSGAAYLFVRRDAAWMQEAYLKASNTVRNMAFGSSIALSPDGGTLAVGAVDESNLTRGIDGDQASTPDNAVSAGAVFVFARTGGWRHQAYIKSSNIGPTDLFGIRLAFSRDGNILAAGAPGQSGGGRGFDARPEDSSAPESGAVYVFVRKGDRWTQQTYVKAPNSGEFDQFGSGVALSADGATLAAATNSEDGGGGINGNQADDSVRDSGAVFVF